MNSALEHLINGAARPQGVPVNAQGMPVVQNVIPDAHLVALVAAHQTGSTPEEAVEWALRAIALSVARLHRLPGMVRSAKED